MEKMSSDERLKLYDNFTELFEKIMEIDFTYKNQTKKWLINEDTLDKIRICENKLKNFWRTGQ